MSDTSLLFSFLKGRDTASPHMRKVAANAAAMSASVRLASVAATAAQIVLAASIAATAAQAVALVAAVSPAVGIIAAIPAVSIAAAAGLATLIMAFSGIGAALKSTAGGAGGAAGAVAAAERRVETAQRAATQAQLDLNAARETAAERLRDMALSLARARLDEEAATMAVADARRSLRDASRGGDRAEIARANLAYRESVQTLDEVKERLGDVAEESTKANEAGVEGSDEVQSAIQRQADAMRDLADAQRALTSGGGGADKAAEAYAKLSMAGRQVVDVLRSIGPAWRQVQQAVQQSALAGVAGDLAMVSGVYLPVMRAQLPAIATGWNNAFRGTLQLAATPGFVADMNTTLANSATMWQRVGASFAPFFSGFRHFAVVGSTFLPSFGAAVQRIAGRFEAWAAAARQTGRAHDWIAKAGLVLGQVWDVTKNLAMSIAAIFRAGDAGPAWLPGLVAGTATLRAFLESDAGQTKMAAVFATLRDIGSQLWEVVTRLGPALLDAVSSGGILSNTVGVFGVVVKFAADHLSTFAAMLPVIIALFIAWRVAQAGAVVIDAVRIPLLIAQTVSNFALAGAMRANMVATGAATATQWGLNTAMLANPIGLIILAIIALVAGFVLLWTHSEGFRNFFIGMWDHIWSFLKMIGAWFAGPFVDFFVGAWNWIKNATFTAVMWVHDKIQSIVDFVTSLPGKIASAASGMWNGLVYSFKAAINWLISLWNNFHLTLGGGTILGVSIPSVTLDTPNLPYMEHGGTVLRAGAAIVADRNGQGGEMVSLPGGAQVTPLRGGGEQTVVIRLETTGAESDQLRMLRKMIRVYGPPDAPKVFG